MKITDEIKMKVEADLKKFNDKQYKSSDDFYFVTRYSGKFLFLGRVEYDRISPMARLTYMGDYKSWDFAIFKWSTEKYDADEFYFSGIEFVDGTITGALKAAHTAYPK